MGKSRIINYLPPGVVVLLSCLPMFLGGFPDGHDWIFELVRLAEYKTALASGQWPPYWATNLYNGYGSPIFLFYAPLFLMVSSLFSFITTNVGLAAVLTLAIFSLIGAWGIHRLLLEILPDDNPASHMAARVASYTMVLGPYLLSDKLLRNANAEFIALMLAPWVFFGLAHIRKKPLAGFIWFSLSLALSICAHNLTALIIFAFALLFAFFLYPPWQQNKNLVITLLSMTQALLLAGFFWIPALALKSSVQIDTLITGKFDFHNQFQPLLAHFGYETFFASGWIIPLVLLMSAGHLLLRPNDHNRPLLLLLLVTALALVFLLHSSSTSVWEKLPFLPLFQFPWRMLGPVSVLVAIITGLLVGYYAQRHGFKIRLGVELLLFTLLLANAWPLLESYRPITTLAVEQLNQLLQPEQIRQRGLRATVRTEYLPRGADITLMKNSATGPFYGARYPLQIIQSEHTNGRIHARVSTPQKNQLFISNWDFPGWKARLNGKPVQLEKNHLHTLSISLPVGESDIELTQGPPFVRSISLWISLAACLIYLPLAIPRVRKLVLTDR